MSAPGLAVPAVAVGPCCRVQSFRSGWGLEEAYCQLDAAAHEHPVTQARPETGLAAMAVFTHNWGLPLQLSAQQCWKSQAAYIVTHEACGQAAPVLSCPA